MVDFSLLQTPDAFGALQQGIERGRQNARRSRVESALASYGNDPEGAEGALIAAGDINTAMSLGQLRRQRQEQQKAAQTEATRRAIGRQYATDPKAAQAAALGAGEFELAESLRGMDADQRKQVAETTEVLASIAYGLKNRPYEERQAILRHMAPDIQARTGISAEQIGGFDPTDENIGALVNSTMSLGDLLKREDSERDYSREVMESDRDFGLKREDTLADNALALRGQHEDERSHRAEEALKRQTEGRLGAADGGGGSMSTMSTEALLRALGGN